MRRSTLVFVILAVLMVWFAVGSIPAFSDTYSSQTTEPIPSQQQGVSIHGQQVLDAVKYKLELEPDKIKAMEQELINPRSITAPVNVVHGMDTNFIVFGYQQSDYGYDYHYLWPALTHVGSSFVWFNSSGTLSNLYYWTNRPSRLKAGGAAQANGTKVIMVIANGSSSGGFSSAVQYSVFTSPSIRQTLVNNIASAVTTDGYCQGVSFDFEPFIANTAVRDGIAAFAQSLSTTLKAINPSYEISYYVDAIYSSSEINLASIMPYLDYVIYSCYDWSVGATYPIAVSDAAYYVPRVNAYLNAGVPPSKMVLAISAYSHKWYTSGTTYTSSITSDIGNGGFFSAYYDSTLQPTYNGPYTENYHRSDETGWYTYNDGSGNRIHVIDDPEAMEFKSRMAKSWKDSNDANNGKRLRGIAFWSLYWMATQSSYDPISRTSVTKTRLYPQLFQLYNEIFSPPGNRNYLVEKFEGPDADRDWRWRDPDESPDTKGASGTAAALTTSPSGTGKPPYSDNAMQVTFTFASTSGNKLFFRHEILNDNNDTGTIDTNAAKFFVNRNAKIRAYLYSAGAYTDRQVRMVVMDTTRQLEMSNPYSIASAGWQTMDWDLTDATQINAYTTAEPAFKSGNGTLDAATTGAKDIGFIGFILEGGSSGSGSVYFDEISYMPTNPGGKNYVVNEFRYSNIAQEYVEIYGPAGAFPSGMQLRFYNSSDGSVNSTIDLTGTIADSGNGFGYWVVGDTGVANVNQVFTNSATQNIPNTQPGAIQIFNAVTGNVYDSVVYQAWGGLSDLNRKQTLGVTKNGYPWIGEVASGTNSSGQTYTIGRYPDGANTWINGTDFSVMPATPGIANGISITSGTNYDFSTAPVNAFQTFQSFTVSDPLSAGLPASPSGGNAYRCIDTTGGGVIGFIGDATLGQNSSGYTVTGEIYIPASTATTQAIAIGICGRQGSNFFTSTKATLDKSGYESGYWLVYENRSGVGLYNGRADHPGTFEFVYAHNDNMDTTKVKLLGSATRTALGISDGGWATFTLSINPAANQVVAQLNNLDIYRGTIPAGGPVSGAFQVAFRENHTGAPTAEEGTWIDNLTFNPYLNNHGDFTASSDTDYWYFEKYGDAATPGALGINTTYGYAVIYQIPGQKGKLSQVFSVPTTGWYTAKAKVWSDISDPAKQQKLYLYLQQLDATNAITVSGNQVVYDGSGYFPGAWQVNQVKDELELSSYAESTNLVVQLVAINQGYSGVTGSLCIDYIKVYSDAPQPVTTVTTLTNPSFDTGTTGWILEKYGDATFAGIWTDAYSDLILSQDSGMKGKASQLFTLTAGKPAYISAWVMSDASAIDLTQKIYLYCYDYAAGYAKIIDSGNIIYQPGKWTPGTWHQLRFVYTPISADNVVQLVGINPRNPWEAVYFDDVVIKQD
ncbi:MAG: glycosyl hydrolase family 18 protein [bacterium]